MIIIICPTLQALCHDGKEVLSVEARRLPPAVNDAHAVRDDAVGAADNTDIHR
jgi:hypothetical protein